MEYNRPAPAAPAPAVRTEGTLTAASLIDAIITHQISQSATDQRFPPTIIRECSPTLRDERQSPPHEDPQPPAHTTSIKLGDLASNIITRDFCSPTQQPQHHNSRYNVGAAVSEYGGGEEWKRREPPKHAPYLEPVSPPDNHHPNSSRANSTRRFSGCNSSTMLTPFDYVTNRIVEVMRSDADERKPALAFPATAYAYPYSALNVPSTTAAVSQAASSTSDGPAPVTSTAPCSAPPAAPEPAPLMSARYEPLSDED